jgi:hypothetical protein
MKTIKILLTICFLLSLSSLWGQKGFDEEDVLYPIYYKETKYALEHVEELPRDTVYIRDTLVVSDIDAFLKPYGCDLKEFVERYGALKSMMDSLNNLSADRLYYNFFLPQDSARYLSNRFFIKEFEVSGNRFTESVNRTKDWEQLTDVSSIRKELLFRFGDSIMPTHIFLKNKLMVRKALSHMFTFINQNPDITGINLFFPNYTFKEKRDMTQFVKSVRILMDASRDFKPEKIRLNVTFVSQGKIDENFRYCLMQEAGEVLFLENSDLVDRYYIKGNRMTEEKLKEISFFPQLKSHFYIARYYRGDLDIRNQNLTEFSESTIAPVIEADYLENKWETYVLVLIILLLIILGLAILYYTYVPFSSLINENIESVLLIAIVVILEIIAIIVSIFRNMCYSDAFAFMHKNPVVIFTLPLIMILIVPFLNGMVKKRRIP